MKWYERKTAKEIVNELNRIGHDCVVCAKQGNIKECEKLFDELDIKFKEVLPVIVDMKTEYWRYKDVNEVYSAWEKCLDDCRNIRGKIEDELVSLKVEF